MKSAAFFLRVVGTGLLFFLLGLFFFVASLGERIGAFAPFFFIYGVFSEIFVSAVQVLA